MSSKQKNNHLANETSPYLQQHAGNPVDWYPWGKEALEKARMENKPILLSIGYAACHWCHVMAHESFEDENTAEMMNSLFVNIKVDREERPDLDKIYQTAHYLLTQRSGGWPLTVFLTPDDLSPFFTGTYFPLKASYQLPSFQEILTAVAELYRHRSDDIKKQNASLTEVLNQPHTVIADLRLNSQPIQHARQALERHLDKHNGGFGGAPKFPQPSRLEFLLTQQSPALSFTLTKMAQGGIYDQLSGGFFRYTVDEKWRIPHFEKMLYDNAQLLLLYAQTYKQDPDPLIAAIIRDTAGWIIEHMQSAAGAYYSSYDADSDGEEGKYYVWDSAEVKALLDDDEFSILQTHFGLDLPPNFEGKWHFYIASPLDICAQQDGISLTRAGQLLASARHKLLNARDKRTPPLRDEKILTSWNALMIKAMLTAGMALDEPRFIESARRALAFIQQRLWRNHRLLAVCKDDTAHLPAYLDDYSFLLDALILSLQDAWDTKNLLFAAELADVMINHFADKNDGGFYFTADDHEKLLYRPKSMMDEAMPSGNAIAAYSLLILGHLLGETRFLSAAEKTLHAAWPLLTRYPAEHAALLLALGEFLQPSKIIVLRGQKKTIQEWQRTCLAFKNTLVFAIAGDDINLPKALREKKPQGEACAYICQGTQCLAVITDEKVLEEKLRE